MDEDYFTTFSPEEISTHILMSAELDSKHLVRARINPRTGTNGTRFDVVIVGYDYLSEFSILCGLLSSFGLDIRSGDIYSFAKHGAKQSFRKIVDVFHVETRTGETFDAAKQREFQDELETHAQLLAAGSINESRERLNRFLTERIELMNEPLSGLLSPIGLDFDNEISSEWTVIDAHSQDTFGFLYAISNALAMGGIYIHKVKIRILDQYARDQFFVADRWGRKIEDAHEQHRLRVAVAMIKQFTRYLREAPDPAKAMRHFDQLIDKIGEAEFPDQFISFLIDHGGMDALAQLLGSSDFLWEEFLRVHSTELVTLLKETTSDLPSRESLRSELRSLLRQAPGMDDFEQKKRILNEFKDRQVFLIDAKHMLNASVSLTSFSQALTDLAEMILDEAAAISYQRLCEQQVAPQGAFTICGLGKFGGREMGYASDLELLFVHETADISTNAFFETLARDVIDSIESRDKGIFHVDLRLRPHGDAGAWSIPYQEFAKYYSAHGEAASFERQALVKLRWVAGDEALGHRVEGLRDSFSYSGEPWDSGNALHLRQRQVRELVKPGQTNVKYSAGGIVDIEYAVQYLQLLHGRERPEVRLTGTLEALDCLHALKILGSTEYGVFRDGYLFLRNLINALRIVRGDASDLVLPEEASEEFKSLARRLGYRERDRLKGAELLASDIRQWMTNVHQHFLQRFG
jgi:glutamate-ammonia-ligase adenylyltransferase